SRPPVRTHDGKRLPRGSARCGRVKMPNDLGSHAQCRACRTSDTRGSLELRDRSAAPSGSRRHIPRPASGSSVPDRSTADPWTNNEVQVRCGARKDREQYRSSVPDDLQGLRHRAEIGRKAALVRSSADPSWLAPTKIRVSKMESRFAASLNGLLQQNLPNNEIHAVIALAPLGLSDLLARSPATF